MNATTKAKLHVEQRKIILSVPNAENIRQNLKDVQITVGVLYVAKSDLEDHVILIRAGVP